VIGRLPPGPVAALGILAYILVACCFPAPQKSGYQPETQGPPSLVNRQATSTGRTEVLTFAWSDINTTPFMGRSGDSFQGAPGSSPEAYTLPFTMNLARLRWAEETYGIPEDWVDFTYQEEEERAAKFEVARARSALRGIRLEMEEDTVHIIPDGEWIVGNSRADVEPLTRGLYDAAVRRGHTDWREFLGTAASFVQALEYKIPPDERVTPGGSKVTTCGATMPLETLHNGWGDCDTKCYLLASILASVEAVPAIILEGERHMFIGVACVPKPGDRYVTVQGIDYVLIETTGPWPLGAIPRSIEDGLQANLYKVTPLHSGG
jgi:hypothetical protein